MGLLILAVFWGLTMSRTIYPRLGGTIKSQAPVTGVVFLLVSLVVGVPWPWGIVPSVAIVAFSAWFAWSSRVPFVFRAWSYHRLTGDAYYTITDPPPTVWKRPRFIQSWWPEWL